MDERNQDALRKAVTMSTFGKEQAEVILRTALNNPNATFREGQWECIDAVLQRKRLLVVQRTGWGKSKRGPSTRYSSRTKKATNIPAISLHIIVEPLLYIVDSLKPNKNRSDDAHKETYRIYNMILRPFELKAISAPIC